MMNRIDLLAVGIKEHFQIQTHSVTPLRESIRFLKAALGDKHILSSEFCEAAEKCGLGISRVGDRVFLVGASCGQAV